MNIYHYPTCPRSRGQEVDHCDCYQRSIQDGVCVKDGARRVVRGSKFCRFHGGTGNSVGASATDAQTTDSRSIQPVADTGSTAVLAAGISGETDLVRPTIDRYSRSIPGGIEQARRHLMADHPELYAYITAREQEKILDTIGGVLSGKVLDESHPGMHAANIVWAEATRRRVNWQRRLREEQWVGEDRCT